MSAPAQADGGPGGAIEPSGGAALPIDLGGYSIAAARRAMEARMQDWKDDATSIRGRLVVACGLVGAETALVFGPVPSLALAAELPELMGAATDGGASAPLSAPLSTLAEQVNLTQEEQQALAKLQSRRVQDTTDQTRLFIDTEELLVRVTERLYQEQIDYHLGRTTGVLGFFRADSEYCAAYTLQNQRDQQLLAAGERILAFDEYLANEIGE